MSKLKKLTAALLAVLMAVPMSLSAFAADTKGGKEEVIYAVTDAGGAVKGLYAVNIFDGGNITDYGDYSSVKILNSTGKITKSGDTVTINSSKDKVYYEGYLNSSEIPWNIAITYKLNGENISPENLAGKSGALTINIKISENKSCNCVFYKNFALQAALKLDTKLSKNIVADGATVANVGADKQLSYIVLPGKGADLTVTADVQNFEMDPITINGVKLNLNFDVDIKASDFDIDLSQITDKLSALKNASTALDNGADKLDSGLSTLNEGMTKINDGSAKLKAGLSALSSGSNALNTGAAKLADSIFASATEKLQAKLAASGLPASEASKYTLTRSNYIDTLAKLSGSAPTAGQTSLALLEIRRGLTAKGISDSNTQNLLMTLANGLLTSGRAANSGDALALSGSMLNDAAFVKTAVNSYSTNTQVLTLALSLMSKPYNLSKEAAVATACTAVSLNSASPQSKLSDAALKVTNASLVSAVIPNADEINSLGKRAASESLIAASAQYKPVKDQLDSVVKFLTLLNSYTDGVDSAADSFNALADGLNSAKSASETLEKGAGELKSGTGELKSETSKIDADKIKDETLKKAQAQIDKKIKDIKSDILGSDEKNVSFISDKNTDVKAVQFVIKTDGIKKEAVLIKPAVKPQLNFWQKFLKLFGLYKD